MSSTTAVESIAPTGTTRVTLAGASDLARLGLESLLKGHRSRAVIRVLSDEHLDVADVDVVLVETHGPGTVGIAAERVHVLVCSGFPLVVTFGENQSSVDRRLLEAAGARAHLGLGLTARELAAALERLPTVRWTAAPHRCPPGAMRPLALELTGCSEREAEVLGLVCRGLGNHEIADKLYISVNTVKTYVRTAYRKIGVDSRTCAVLWGMENGL